MHALRVHCGSFLYDNLRQQWLSEEERRAMEGSGSAGEHASPAEPTPRAEGGRGTEKKAGDEGARGEEQESGQQVLEWPLFETPSLATIRVTSYKEKQGTIYFAVQPTLEGFRWSLDRTYDEFAHLHKALVEHHGISKALLPGKKLFGYFGTPKPQYLVEMQGKLDVMLKTVLQKYPVPPTVLMEFCGYPFCDVLSITQLLAIYFFDEGDRVLSNNKAVHMSPVQLHCIGRRMTLPIASSATGSLRGDFGNLLDFLMQLQKLKVAPSTEDRFTLLPMENVNFELSLLKSLTFLLVDSVDLKDLQGRQHLTTQLEGLDIRRCLTSLQEILVVYPVDTALPHPATVDLSRALPWTYLKTICFKLNSIQTIDSSLQLLPSLERLDLSYNCIEKIENLTELPHLKVVDLSHNKISNVFDLHMKIGNVAKLGLAHNQLASLEGMSKCFSLLYLDLSYNLIAEITEVHYISELPILEDLYLEGNPIKQSPSYRSLVLSQLPVTGDKICLDARKASQDELELSASLAGTKGHKRVPSRTADIKPDRDELVAQEAQGEFDEAASQTSQLEEMRKTGGDKWLSIFNAERTKQSGFGNSSDSDDVVVHSPKERKKKHHRKQHHQLLPKPIVTKEKVERSIEPESSAPLVGHNSFPIEVEEEELSQELQETIQTLQSEKLHLSDFPVTVLEYAGPLHTLSGQDVDQKLVNSPLEECTVCVDTSVMRVVETVLSTNKTRSQRDLALLKDIRLHEGKKKGVCLQFAQFSGNPFWVIYCVRNVEALARLYVAVRQGLQSIVTPQESVASGTSTPEVCISGETEESDGSPRAQSGLVSQLQSKLNTEVQAAGVSGKQTGITHPLQRSTELPPSAEMPSNAKEGSLSTPVTPLRSRSPTPETEASSKPRVKGYSTLTSPVQAKARATKAGAMEKEKHGSSSEANSQEPSPVSPRRETQPAEAAAVAEIEHHSGRRVSPLPEKKNVKPPEPLEASVSPAESQGGKAAQPSAESSMPLSLALASVKDSKPVKLTTGTRKIVKKPSLASQSLVNFFNGKIAREHKEVLLNILWGGASLTSTPGCEVEVGLFVTDKGLYLLQVMDPEKDDSQTLSWNTENAPLISSFHAYHLTLSHVKMGIFDQSIIFECIEKGALKSLVVFPRTYENMFELLENLKAALDSSGITHGVTTVQESIMSVSDNSSNVLFINPDVSDLQKLKESLVKPRVIVQISNSSMGHTDQSSFASFTEETKKMSEDFAAKFEIVQYVVVSEISSDLLPISNGSVHFRPRVLVLTNQAIYLCKDEISSWPADPNSPVAPPFSRCSVLDSYPIESVSGIEICDKAQAIVSISDPIYEFRISFDIPDNVHGSRGNRSWQLCVYDRQYIDQFFSCLQPLWSDIRCSTLTIAHTTEPLVATALSPSPPAKIKRARSLSVKSDITSYKPSFYESKALVHFASLTSSERLKFFRERVSEAQFLKSDEVPLAVFLGYCSSSKQDFTQIEACIVASQYAVYLLSDVENIRKWLDNGGASSFSRMSLMNKQDADEARCFFRLWINEIKEIRMGFFYLSMQLTASKAEQSFAIHSQDASAMLSLLSALSCTANLRNTFEDKVFNDLLSDYIDLGGDSLTTKARHAQKNVKTNVEFKEPTMDNQETLKQILLCISPSISKSSTIEQSTSGLQILLGQVMLMIEEINIRDSHTVQYQLQLVLLSNYGLFVCANSGGEKYTPAVLQPDDLKVKRWCHIDLIDHVEVVSNPRFQQCKGHVISINLRSQKGVDGGTLIFVAQNSEQLSHFLYLLSLLWRERNEKNLQVYRI